jgi:lipopolysaccharide/colanic/teichoic acid biosynthesis glycosyltransferase
MRGQMRRFSVRPGVTGLWQVSGRSGTSDEERMRLDREYVNHWSLWLDLKILARTPAAVLSGRGAV